MYYTLLLIGPWVFIIGEFKEQFGGASICFSKKIKSPAVRATALRSSNQMERIALLWLPSSMASSKRQEFYLLFFTIFMSVDAIMWW